MESLKYMRAEDNLEADAARNDNSSIEMRPLLGTWINTNNQTRGIAKVVIEIKNNDLTINVFGAGTAGLIDWGKAPIDIVYAANVRSRDAHSFSATYNFGFVEIHLQANLSLGLLVIAGLNSFRDGSARSNYFSREFFYQAEQGIDSDGAKRSESLKCLRAEEDVDLGAAEANQPIDGKPFLGSWYTTNRATRGIVRINIEPSGDSSQALTLRTYGACTPSPCDWGETGGKLYSESPASRKGLAFSAVYDFEFMETHLQAKIKKGVLVVAVFNRFKDDSGRSNYFSREFFYSL